MDGAGKTLFVQAGVVADEVGEQLGGDGKDLGVDLMSRVSCDALIVYLAKPTWLYRVVD